MSGWNPAGGGDAPVGYDLVLATPRTLSALGWCFLWTRTRTPGPQLNETRRRVKLIGRLPGEQAACGWSGRSWTAPPRGWRGVVMTPAAVRLLQQLRRQLHHPSQLEEEVVHQRVTPAA